MRASVTVYLTLIVRDQMPVCLLIYLRVGYDNKPLNGELHIDTNELAMI